MSWLTQLDPELTRMATEPCVYNARSKKHDPISYARIYQVKDLLTVLEDEVSFKVPCPVLHPIYKDNILLYWTFGPQTDLSFSLGPSKGVCTGGQLNFRHMSSCLHGVVDSLHILITMLTTAQSLSES